ncbi:MAG TPA: uracil-DNA glycosylase [Anaerolineales bacterium]|nr:uracil-DNA glycosylase [Anaerolineales bacterium]HMS00033.1 uracil-DNA glycosylase [Anaerolineales bacterium]HNQ95536.1 uracil-DNA glycosylase [Anaerolineales bacterium]HNS59971.1 uracil-DNA glycosylase [Anaerolineales bacterium]
MPSQLESLNTEIIACRKCPRLVAWREEVARVKRKAYRDQEYWGKPVPGFGDPKARVLVVGLAPGAHGSNRTGRAFTGDASGGFLYPALHKAGFANQAEVVSRSDGLRLKDLYITAVARCVPPDNKPSLEELKNCQPYLERELEIIKPKVIVCLGRIAYERILKIFSIRDSSMKFAHGATFDLRPSNFQPATLLCSYHPSQQNTLTGKLTVKMFDDIWRKTEDLLK